MVTNMKINCGKSVSEFFRPSTVLSGAHEAVGRLAVGDHVLVDGVEDAWGDAVPLGNFRVAINVVAKKTGMRFLTRTKSGGYPVMVKRVE